MLAGATRDTPRAPFDALSAERGLLLAVSGGADSMALLHLAHEWGQEGDTPLIEVASVDHGLRAEAGAEIDLVAARCAALGITHHRLKLEAPPPRAIQASARFGRYRLLANCARDRGVSAIVTAHHADDQAETVRMRLDAKSGLSGLAGIRAVSVFDGIKIVRPLLGERRAALRAYAAGFGAFADDPSNDDRRFERVRVRQSLDEAMTARLLAIAYKAGRLRHRREAALRTAIDACAEFDPRGIVIIEQARFAALPESLAADAAGFCAMIVSGAQHLAPAPARREFAAAILSGKGATLSGAQAIIDRDKCLIAREWGREGIATIALKSSAMIWDERFAVSGDITHMGYKIGPLGDVSRKMLEDDTALDAACGDLPFTVRRTLPAIFDGAGEIIFAGGKWLKNQPAGLTISCEWTGEKRFLMLP